MLRLDAELNKDTISKLKKPLGKLSVGDATFNNLTKYELYPDIGIIDNLIQRKNHNHEVIKAENILKAKNPAGTITDDLWETIGQAMELSGDGNCHVIEVDGEEDLAVLPCILMASDETTILYGQPNEGLVLLKVYDAKDYAQNLIDTFIKE